MPLVLDFVQESFGEDDYKAFKKYFDIKVKHRKDPLVKAGGLQAMLECFLKQNKKLRSALEDGGAKKGEAKPKKRARSDSNASSEHEPAKKRRRASSVVSEASVSTRTRHKVDLPPAEQIKAVPFKRIDESLFEGKISHNLADCTFEAKARFGEGGDSYGAWSNEKLRVTQGASFVKMKNKMKNRNTHASGTFNAAAVNSIKF